MPGPEVAVKAREPFQAAPITIPIDASSSSACRIATLLFLVSGSTRRRRQWLVKASATEDDRVIAEGDEFEIWGVVRYALHKLI